MATKTERSVEVLQPTDAERDQLQRLADRLADVKTRLNEASAQEDNVRDELYDLLDGIAGPNSYVIFEAGPPSAGWRMSREISRQRSFDVDGLRTVLKTSQFKQVTRVEVDTKALDVLLSRGDLDADIVARYTTYTPRARGPLWRPASGELHLEAGQLAVVTLS